VATGGSAGVEGGDDGWEMIELGREYPLETMVWVLGETYLITEQK
jgi:hypothetical protein